MVDNRSNIHNYILVIKTLYGNPDDSSITVVIKGTCGQTERISLGKSQSHDIAFRDNQTDLFSILSFIDVGKLLTVEFYSKINAKFQEWKYSNVLVLRGTCVYHDVTSEHCLVPSIGEPTVSNMIEPFVESSENIYYAFVKTGNGSCSNGCYPKLSLFGNHQQQHSTQVNMKSSCRMRSPSMNNNDVLEKQQLDIFQWQDHPIGKLQRMRLQLYSESKEFDCIWPVEWILVVHNGHTFTGRIMLNRIVKTERFIGIDLEQTISDQSKSRLAYSLPLTGDYGDTSKQLVENTSPHSILSKQSNAAQEEMGRYYVIVKNSEGTSGNVFVEFHGDHLASSGEQYLGKSENYPSGPFGSGHTDLFHVKAPEVGRILSISIRVDQTEKEHRLILESIYIVHNNDMSRFELKKIVLHKEQPKKIFTPATNATLPIGKARYYVAIHTADKILSGTNADFKILVTGSAGVLGPMNLKESLTNGDNPFEKECIDIFHIDGIDIGDPTSITITLEPNGMMQNIFSGAKCERIMLVKDGEYHSQWQTVGNLNPKEPVVISLPIRKILSSVTPTNIGTNQMVTVPRSTLHSLEQTTQPLLTTRAVDVHAPSGDFRQKTTTMAEIEDHQKRNTFAPNLPAARQNYRELRRLLRKAQQPAKVKRVRAPRKTRTASKRTNARTATKKKV